eukprot:tig00000944_g5959.t1
MVVPRNIYRFARYGFSNDVSFALNADGNHFGSITAYGLGTVGAIGSASPVMPAVAEFANLFDSYKLNRVTIEIISPYDGNLGPQNNSTSATASGAWAPTPKIYWYYDIDDNTAPADSLDLHERIDNTGMLAADIAEA